MKRLKEYYITIILIIVVIAVNLAAFSSYLTNVEVTLNEQTKSKVDSIVDEAVECINIKLEEQVNTLNDLATFMAICDENENGEEIKKSAIEKQKNNIGYEVLEIVGIDGKGIETGTDYSDKSFFKSAVLGDHVIIEDGEENNVEAMYFATPVKENKKVKYVIVGRMNIDKFTESIDIAGFSQNGKALLVKKDGTLISKTKDLTNAKSINDIFPEKTYEDKLLNGMKSKKSGVFRYISDDNTRYIGYARLNFNKWYVVCIFSASAVQAETKDVAADLIILGVEIGIILLALISYLIYNIVVVTNKGNMNRDRYFIAAKYTDKILIDYSLAKNTMYCNDKWFENFGTVPPSEDVKENVKNHICEEDYPIYEENINDMFEKKEDVDFTIRIINKEKKNVKCRVRLFPICEKKKKITKIIALIEPGKIEE